MHYLSLSGYVSRYSYSGLKSCCGILRIIFEPGRLKQRMKSGNLMSKEAAHNSSRQLYSHMMSTGQFVDPPCREKVTVSKPVTSVSTETDIQDNIKQQWLHTQRQKWSFKVVLPLGMIENCLSRAFLLSHFFQWQNKKQQQTVRRGEPLGYLSEVWKLLLLNSRCIFKDIIPPGPCLGPVSRSMGRHTTHPRGG